MQPEPMSYEEKIKRIVDEIMNEKNDNPRDSTFKFFHEYYGEAQHINLRYPGEYLKKLPKESFTINNRTRTMDAAEMVNPDDILPYQSTINPEQQTTPLNPDKKEALYDYKLQLTFKYRMPSLNVVVTNIGDEDHTVIYESHGDAYKTYVRVFNEEEISQRLNTLSDNIKNEKKLSEIEVLDFAYVLMFAQENKEKEYSEKIAKLFAEVKNLELNEQLGFHYVLKKLIRLHFRDDLNKTKELLIMITKALHPDVLEGMSTLEQAFDTINQQEEKLYQQEEKLSTRLEIVSAR